MSVPAAAPATDAIATVARQVSVARCRAGRTGKIVPHSEPRSEHPAGDIADGEERDEHAPASSCRDRGGGGRHAQHRHGEQRPWERGGVLCPQNRSASRADGG